MKKLFMIFLLITLLYVTTLAQQRLSSDPPARLIDSFGNVELSDLKARLDNFALELQNAPATKGFIVAYPASNQFPGWTLRRANASQEYLTTTRGLDAGRVAIINGGFRNESTFELWVIAPDADLSIKPFDISLTMSGQKTPLPFDRFPIVEHGDRNEYSDDDYSYYPESKSLYAPFIDILRHDPTLRGCVIAYSAPHTKLGADRKLASRVKVEIVKAYAIDVSRIAAFGGGRRKEKMVELWLVPPGSELPKPTPTVRPIRRKKR
jgi:hypothetical protein